MNQKTDFHIHTYYSDGLLSPAAVVKRAKEMEYATIAITDHDGIDGVKEAMIAGEALEIRVIPGIELSSGHANGENVHILGYSFDLENQELTALIEEVREHRNRRNVKLLEVLTGMGYPIPYEELLNSKGKNYVGKPNIARAMVRLGYISDYKDAFAPGRFLESPEAKAVRKEKVPCSRAVEAIKAAGGMAVIAHPMKIKGLGQRGSQTFYKQLEDLIANLKKVGLKGLECFHPDQTHEESLKLVELAEKYHLHITEGSDFHGDK